MDEDENVIEYIPPTPHECRPLTEEELEAAGLLDE